MAGRYAAKGGRGSMKVIRRDIHLEKMQRVQYLPSMDWNEIYNSDKPLVLTGLAKDWPAVASGSRQWADTSRLQKRLTDPVIVSVEVGSSYMDPNVRRVDVPISDLLALFAHEEENPKASSEIPPIYLAQNELKAIPQLLEDVKTPELCSTGKGHLYTSMVWMNGVRGATSPCHYDPFRNVLVQVYGEKEVTMFSPNQSNNLYPALGTTQKNTSRVDIEQPNFSSHPNARDLVGVKATLQAGDALYMPFKWWHFCRSRGKSCSVNFWWLGGNEKSPK